MKTFVLLFCVIPLGCVVVVVVVVAVVVVVVVVVVAAAAVAVVAGLVLEVLLERGYAENEVDASAAHVLT